MSPFEVLFGRQRHMAGIPYEPLRRAEDAEAFFRRQEDVDAKVATMMNNIHDKQVEQVNKRRRELAAFEVDDRVWYLRPRGKPGEKLETYWIGPCRVAERRSDHGYVVDIDTNTQQEAHRSQLKPYIEDVWSGRPVKLFRFRRAVVDNEDVQPDQWTIKKVEGHRRGADGYPEFKVEWDGSDERTWEPLHHFFHQYSQPLLDYCVDKGVRVDDVLEYLHKHPAEVVIGEVWEEPPEEWCWDADADEADIEEDEAIDMPTPSRTTSARKQVRIREPTVELEEIVTATPAARAPTGRRAAV